MNPTLSDLFEEYKTLAFRISDPEQEFLTLAEIQHRFPRSRWLLAVPVRPLAMIPSRMTKVEFPYWILLDENLRLTWTQKEETAKKYGTIISLKENGYE